MTLFDDIYYLTVNSRDGLKEGCEVCGSASAKAANFDSIFDSLRSPREPTFDFHM